jgi:hypothetical protein
MLKPITKEEERNDTTIDRMNRIRRTKQNEVKKKPVSIMIMKEEGEKEGNRECRSTTQNDLR